MCFRICRQTCTWMVNCLVGVASFSQLSASLRHLRTKGGRRSHIMWVSTSLPDNLTVCLSWDRDIGFSTKCVISYIILWNKPIFTRMNMPIIIIFPGIWCSKPRKTTLWETLWGTPGVLRQSQVSFIPVMANVLHYCPISVKSRNISLMWKLENDARPTHLPSCWDPEHGYHTHRPRIRMNLDSNQ